MHLLLLLTLAYGNVLRIPIPDEWRACKSTKDCIQISARCDDCCEEEGLNRKSLEKYKAERAKACPTDKIKETPKDAGPVCDCQIPKYHLECVAKLCEIVYENKK